MLDTVKTLCSLSGVSGMENEVRSYILERVLPYAAEIQTDSMGNLMVLRKGKQAAEAPLMLCAHMDEVGLIVTGITEEGLLRFDTVGGIDRRVLIGKKVFVGEKRVPGVISLKAYHLVSKSEEEMVPPLDSLYLDIGCLKKSEAEALVTLGDVAVFDDGVTVFGDGFLKAKAIDDRVGCAALLELIVQEPPRDCWFVFTVQEEVGTRGAQTAAFRVAPSVALILEGTTAADLPGVSGGKEICHLGRGVVLPFMDGGTLYDRELYRCAMAVAEKRGIAWQTKSRIAGGTDASAIQRSRGGVKTLGLAVPIRNIHSPASVAKLSDMEAMVQLAAAMMEELT